MSEIQNPLYSQKESDNKDIKKENKTFSDTSEDTSSTVTTSPFGMSTSQTNVSPTKEFMTLTPVKIMDNYSPLKELITNSLRRPGNNPPMRTNNHGSQSPTYETIYQEKFNSISSQLVSLLENLNVTYQKIGYTSFEITTKEKTVFNELSSLLQHFYDESDVEMKQLSADNDTDQEVLNIILDILKDPSGIDTVPDLYVRNAIIRPTSKKVPQSPKKPLTLLSKKSSLDTAKGFIFDAYIPKLIKFSEMCLYLQKFVNSLEESNINGLNPNDNIIHLIPALNDLQTIMDSLNQDFQSHDNAIEMNTFVRKFRKILLNNESYKDLSDAKFNRIEKFINLYKAEFKSRLFQNEAIINEIQGLLIELNTNPEEDLNSEQLKELHYGSSLIGHIQDNNIGKLLIPNLKLNANHLEILQQILDRYLMIRSKRLTEKKKMIQSCQKLWAMLKISDAEIEDFLSNNRGLSLQVFDNLRSEIQKLEVKKKKQIKQLITESLEKINELWETLQTDKDYRDTFFERFNYLFGKSQNLMDDENLLKICNTEIEQLNEKMRMYEPILQLLKEFQSLQEDELFLENSSKDSSRLLSRNSHKILLKEENTRKRLTRHFPRVLSDLSSKLLEAEDKFQKPFFYQGQNLLDVVTREEEAFSQKHPRSRLNMGGERRSRINNERIPSGERSRSNTQTNDKYMVVKPNGTQPNRNIMRRKTSPIRYIPTTHNSELASRSISLNSKLPRFNEDIITAVSTVSGIVKSKNTHTRLLAPTRIARKTLSTPSISRPILRREQSSNLSTTLYSSPAVRTAEMDTSRQLHGIKPTQLFPMNLNKLEKNNNQVTSGIPTLSKTNSILTALGGKENLSVGVAMLSPRITIPRENSNLNAGQTTNYNESMMMLSSSKMNSPYRELDHSVYQLSMSPDGKFKLNIQERELDNPFDDTSILEE